MIFATALTANQSAIASITEQIATLQEQLATLQRQQQALQSLEGASQTALEQVARAIQMTNAIAPEEISAFKDAIDALFENPPVAEIPAAVEITIEEPPTTDDEGWGELLDDDTLDIPIATSTASDEPDIPLEESTTPAAAGVTKSQDYSSNGRKHPSTVGAQQLDITQLTLPEIKEACNDRGITLKDVQRYGKGSSREAWIAAYSND